MRKLNGRVAVVTGGASGIGLGMAKAFAREGMKVVIADIEPFPLEAAAAEVAAQGGGPVMAVRTDVSDADAVESLAAQVFTRFGAVHVLCNNAGVGGGGAQHELSVADWRWVLGVNLYGVVHGIASFLPRMLASDEPGHIVNTASMAGLSGAPGMGPYNASKFAVVGLTESLYKEQKLAGSRIGVSVLCPGWVNTRIADSHRNRPADLPAPVARPGAGERGDMVRQLLANGMDPSGVADLVLDAIAQERFWIFTDEQMVAGLRPRIEAMLAGGNPPVGP